MIARLARIKSILIVCLIFVIITAIIFGLLITQLRTPGAERNYLPAYAHIQIPDIFKLKETNLKKS